MSCSVVSDDTEGATATRSDVGGSDWTLGKTFHQEGVTALKQVTQFVQYPLLEGFITRLNKAMADLTQWQSTLTVTLE